MDESKGAKLAVLMQRNVGAVRNAVRKRACPGPGACVSVFGADSLATEEIDVAFEEDRG